MFNRTFDQYAIGEKWVSRGRTVTEADLVNFAGVSGDFYALHTDAEYAKSTPFGQRVAHGMLVLSISTGLMEFTPGIVLAFYGIDLWNRPIAFYSTDLYWRYRFCRIGGAGKTETALRRDPGTERSGKETNGGRSDFSRY